MELVGIRITLVYFWMTSFARMSYQAENVLYPFGPSEGDTKLPSNDDGDSGKIKLDLKFPYFDEDHASLIVNTNGIISFIKNVSQYTPDVFPLDDDRRIIAPYWADVDTSGPRGENGKVWYRQTTNDTSFLQNLTDQIGSIFRVEFRFRPFVAKFAFVATWENVTFYSISGGAALKTNTFQAVLVSDGDYSFTIFNYEKLEWTTGSSSFGDKGTGLAGNSSVAVAAQVGFNAGDGSNYYSVPGSRTDAILEISQTSNILVPGRWVFRIDGKSVEAGGCREDTANAAQLQISPQQVSMLGGDVLSISGPCFQSTNIILCRIEDVVIEAIYDPETDPFTVRCPSPLFMRVGPSKVMLSRDGGGSYNYTGHVSVVGLDRIEPAIRSYQMADDIISLTWNTEGFPSPDSRAQDIYIDILLYFYKEDTTTGLVQLAPARQSAIRKNTRLDNDRMLLSTMEISDVARERESDVSVGIFRITEANEVKLNMSNRWVDGNLDIMNMETPIAAMWSLPFNLNPDSSTSEASWCSKWASDQIPPSTDNAPPCPCLLQQALADIGGFEDYPWCDHRFHEECPYRWEANHCVRAKIASSRGYGQLCCYGFDGNILHLNDTPAGGYTQKHHHRGFLPPRFPGNIPYLSNYLWDRIPWEECCGKTRDGTAEERGRCDLFRGKRPSSDCKDYRAPAVGAVFGEPHFITFDGKDYIFNGHGEYTLVMTDDTQPPDGRIQVQGRLQQLDEYVRATGLTAVAAGSDTSSTVHVELNDRREMDAWIRADGSDESWNNINFIRSNYWMDDGVTIELGFTEDNRKLLWVTFDQGIAIMLEKPFGSTAMSVRIYIPSTLKEKVIGLLGTWNDDATDDFTIPSGRSITGNSPENLHKYFGQEWNVDPSESLFRYDVGLNHSLINHEDYEPNFDFEQFVTDEELDDVCGDNRFCIYDFIKTGVPNMAEAAGNAHNMWQRTRNHTTNVVSCGYLPPPGNGSKVGVVYLAGSMVTMTCNKGFDMIGTVEWLCRPIGSWSGNETTTCVESKDTRMWLILYIVMAIVAFLILISCCLICFVCIMRRRKDKEHDKERERSKSNAGLSVAYQNGGYTPDGGITKINGTTPTSNGISNGNGASHHIATEEEIDGGVANGQPTNARAANGHTANGHAATNGHTTNGHAAASNTRGHAEAPPSQNNHETGTLDSAAGGAVGVSGDGSVSSSNVSSPRRPAQVSTSHRDQPSTSNDPASNYKGGAPPIEKKLKKKAKENPYDALPASLKSKLNNPDYETLSKYRKEIPALMEYIWLIKRYREVCTGPS
ncbi:sushi domain-containing protein 2-like isoform X2 [Lytechinus variegatus]|uniref:sushi domain-containing protein 2-like isoform X2 n=1 Tax=Lytechinus variegatus TaxID=7654 RepID=UPI001BB0FE8B|nr:sushi domain-containing protein 2-like isoform X2 [Lytechinus variegatus]